MIQTEKQRQQAISYAWRTGQLRYLFRDHQMVLYDAWVKSRTISRKFLVCNGRGWGKSTFWFMVALEWTIKHPYTDVYFVAPVEKKLDDYLEPIRKKVQSRMPSNFQYVYSASDNI